MQTLPDPYQCGLCSGPRSGPHRKGDCYTACMTDQADNLILEHLRAIRSALQDHGDRLSRIELRLSAIEQTLGSLYALSGSDRERLDSLTRRVERIERRLELSDAE